MAEKGNTVIRTVPIIPKRDMREIKGKYEEIVLKENYEGTSTDDYMHITLTDEEDIPDVMNKLRVIYPNIMKLDYDNKRTRSASSASMAEDIEKKSPLDLFADFYEKQNGQPMSAVQTDFIRSLAEEIWEGEK